jgi:hypothetical protein
MLNPLYTTVKNHDHGKILRAFKTLPKAIPWKLKNHLSMGFGCEV